MAGAKFSWSQYDEADPDTVQPGSSGFNWDQHPVADESSPGLISQIGSAVASGANRIGNAVDSYTGAPTRAAISAAMSGQNPISAFGSQFGADPSTAPTGKDIAAKAGLSTSSILSPQNQKMLAAMAKGSPIGFVANAVAPGSVEKATGASPAGIVGAGIDIGANPINYVPVGDVVEGASNVAGDALKGFAEKKAIASTGATGAQAAKFAPNAGRELLDQGIVGFGNSQAQVANKAAAALEASGKKIGDALSSLDSKGVTVEQQDIVDAIRQRAKKLGKDPAQFGVADSLNKTADRMQAMIEANGGKLSVPISEAEATKRGFQAGANFNSAPADLSHAKEVSGIYQKVVEDAATKADPDTAKLFMDQKKAYGLLSPIEEAATRRASTLNQSPHGGLLDTATMIAGEGLAGAPGAFAAPIIRRAAASRSAATMAGAADFAGNLLKSNPSEIGSAASGIAKVPAAQSAVSSPGAVVALPNAAQVAPQTGPDAWARQGIQNLGLDPKTAAKVLADPKGKQLAIQASSFKPNSRALAQIMDQIQKGWGQG